MAGIQSDIVKGYPLVDPLSRQDREALREAGFWELAHAAAAGRFWAGNHYLRALPTGEFRHPRKGEWYLSGAIVEAYRARADRVGEFHVARLAVVERSVTVREEIVLIIQPGDPSKP